MFLTEDLSINEKGHLKISDCDTVELARKYGTPLYVINENLIRKRCNIYKNAIKKYYNNNGLPIYASKAFSCLKMCKIIKEENLGLDVVSEGELYTALKAGFPAEKIHFHGNNKSYSELYMAVKENVGKIVVDNIQELKILQEISVKLDKNISISLRVKPGIEAHTHEFIKTGQIDSKFGFALENNEALEAIKFINNLKNVELKELHCHIGSQIFNINPFILAAETMMDFIHEIYLKFNLIIKELNLGGGFGAVYTEKDVFPDYQKYIKCISETIYKKSEEHKIPAPFLFLEPGRSIVAEAGITLYTVGCVKSIYNTRNYVMIDGGMCDNPRYALYQADYTAVIANKMNENKDFLCTIAGKCCESGDLIQKDIYIQNPKAGDIMAVFSTGAYNYSMASNYNKILKPPVILIKNKIPEVIINRETLDNLIKNEL